MHWGTIYCFLVRDASRGSIQRGEKGLGAEPKDSQSGHICSAKKDHLI